MNNILTIQPFRISNYQYKIENESNVQFIRLKNTIFQNPLLNNRNFISISIDSIFYSLNLGNVQYRDINSELQKEINNSFLNSNLNVHARVEFEKTPFSILSIHRERTIQFDHSEFSFQPIYNILDEIPIQEIRNLNLQNIDTSSYLRFTSLNYLDYPSSFDLIIYPNSIGQSTGRKAIIMNLHGYNPFPLIPSTYYEFKTHPPYYNYSQAQENQFLLNITSIGNLLINYNTSEHEFYKRLTLENWIYTEKTISNDPEQSIIIDVVGESNIIVVENFGGVIQLLGTTDVIFTEQFHDFSEYAEAQSILMQNSLVSNNIILYNPIDATHPSFISNTYQSIDNRDYNRGIKRYVCYRLTDNKKNGDDLIGALSGGYYPFPFNSNYGQQSYGTSIRNLPFPPIGISTSIPSTTLLIPSDRMDKYFLINSEGISKFHAVEDSSFHGTTLFYYFTSHWELHSITSSSSILYAGFDHSAQHEYILTTSVRDNLLSGATGFELSNDLQYLYLFNNSSVVRATLSSSSVITSSTIYTGTVNDLCISPDGTVAGILSSNQFVEMNIDGTSSVLQVGSYSSCSMNDTTLVLGNPTARRVSSFTRSGSFLSSITGAEEFGSDVQINRAGKICIGNPSISNAGELEIYTDSYFRYRENSIHQISYEPIGITGSGRRLGQKIYGNNLSFTSSGYLFHQWNLSSRYGKMDYPFLPIFDPTILSYPSGGIICFDPIANVNGNESKTAGFARPRGFYTSFNPNVQMIGISGFTVSREFGMNTEFNGITLNNGFQTNSVDSKNVPIHPHYMVASTKQDTRIYLNTKKTSDYSDTFESLHFIHCFTINVPLSDTKVRNHILYGKDIITNQFTKIDLSPYFTYSNTKKHGWICERVSVPVPFTASGNGLEKLGWGANTTLSSSHEYMYGAITFLSPIQPLSIYNNGNQPVSSILIARSGCTSPSTEFLYNNIHIHEITNFTGEITGPTFLQEIYYRKTKVFYPLIGGATSIAEIYFPHHHHQIGDKIGMTGFSQGWYGILRSQFHGIFDVVGVKDTNTLLINIGVSFLSSPTNHWVLRAGVSHCTDLRTVLSFDPPSTLYSIFTPSTMTAIQMEYEHVSLHGELYNGLTRWFDVHGDYPFCNIQSITNLFQVNYIPIRENPIHTYGKELVNSFLSYDFLIHRTGYGNEGIFDGAEHVSSAITHFNIENVIARIDYYNPTNGDYISDRFLSIPHVLYNDKEDIRLDLVKFNGTLSTSILSNAFTIEAIDKRNVLESINENSRRNIFENRDGFEIYRLTN